MHIFNCREFTVANIPRVVNNTMLLIVNDRAIDEANVSYDDKMQSITKFMQPRLTNCRHYIRKNFVYSIDGSYMDKYLNIIILKQ